MNTPDDKQRQDGAAFLKSLLLWRDRLEMIQNGVFATPAAQHYTADVLFDSVRENSNKTTLTLRHPVTLEELTIDIEVHLAKPYRREQEGGE